MSCGYCSLSETKRVFEFCGKCKVQKYCCRECQVKDWIDHKPKCGKGGSSNWTDSLKIVDIPNKGKGIVATRDFNIGDLVMSCGPVLGCPIHIDADEILRNNFRLLDQEKQVAYLSLFNSHPSIGSEVIGVAKTNSLPNGTNPTGSNVFLNISRLNHSCDPNVCHSWNEILKKEVIYAVKTIKAGEEILTCYHDPYKQVTKNQRQMFLLQGFGFLCDCPLCKKSDTDAENLIFEEMKRLDDDIPRLAAIGNHRQALRICEKLYNMQSVQLQSRVAYDAYNICYRGLRDVSKSKMWLRRAITARVIAEGDCPESRRLQNLLDSI